MNVQELVGVCMSMYECVGVGRNVQELVGMCRSWQECICRLTFSGLECLIDFTEVMLVSEDEDDEYSGGSDSDDSIEVR